mmetsp:Transcript_33539/g.34845  ORF Transcript_33539/g.34845 Transcript_33539/m.34845 type:complete len:235 (-) Transcript_33539:61-765(-)
MSSIIANLKSIKDKIANFGNLKDSEKPEEKSSEERKKRVKSKVENYFKNTKTVFLNIGGEAIIPSAVHIYLDFSYQLSIKEKIKTIKENSLEKPLFIDMSFDVWETLAEIIRINPSEPHGNLIYTKADLPVLEVEAARLFLSDWSRIKSMLSIKYLPETKRLKLLKSYQEKGVVDNVSNLWESKIKIKCYICGVANDGKLWKLKYSNSSRRDDFVVDGYFATCKKCDPEKKMKY